MAWKTLKKKLGDRMADMVMHAGERVIEKIVLSVIGAYVSWMLWTTASLWQQGRLIAKQGEDIAKIRHIVESTLVQDARNEPEKPRQAERSLSLSN